MKRVAASLAVLGLLFLSSDPAEACSPACDVAKLAPAAGATVPASAPGFLLVGSTAQSSSVTLVDGNGSAVAGSFQKDAASGRTYFAPTTALAPGSYATRGLKSCSGDETVDATFTVTAAAALPTSTGSLAVKKSARETLSAWTSSGSCTEPVDAAYVDLEVTADPALVPYLSVVTWQTKVDGKWWSGKDPIDLLGPPSGNAHSYLRLFTACDGTTPVGRDPGLTDGKHDVELRAFLPGGAALTAAKISVNVSCSSSNGEVVDSDDIVGDGEITGSGDPSGGSDPSFGSGGGRTSGTDSTGGAAFPRSQGGCTAARAMPQSSPSTNILAASLALLALAGLRRRRNPLS